MVHAAMTITRAATGILATVLLLAALLLALRDVRIDGANCGSALLRKDPLTTRLLSGDPDEDMFEEHRILSTCDREIAKRRFVAALPLAGGIGCIVVGRRLRDRDTKQHPPVVW